LCADLEDYQNRKDINPTSAAIIIESTNEKRLSIFLDTTF
jgi:hypothetical protein